MEKLISDWWDKFKSLKGHEKAGVVFFIIATPFSIIWYYNLLFRDLPQVKVVAEPQVAVVNSQEAKYGPKPIFNGWDGSYREIEAYLKPLLNDPDSLKWEGCSEPYIRADCGWQIRCSYRAKNAFGAMVLTRSFFCISNGQVVEMRPN